MKNLFIHFNCKYTKKNNIIVSIYQKNDYFCRKFMIYSKIRLFTTLKFLTYMIFYFSGTGNTRWVAQQIAEAIGEELLCIPDLLREKRFEFKLEENEKIGFCFPTHGWQPPRIVRQFIRQLILVGQHSHFCWALTTCGDNMGEAMTIFNKELAAKSGPHLIVVVSYQLIWFYPLLIIDSYFLMTLFSLWHF